MGKIFSEQFNVQSIDWIMSQVLSRQDHQLPEHTKKCRQDRYIYQTGLNVNTSKTDDVHQYNTSRISFNEWKPI